MVKTSRGAAGNRAVGPAPLTDQFGLSGIVKALLEDYQLLREGTISVPEARARAELAKQAMRGLSLIVQARKMLEQIPPSALPSPPPKKE